MVTTTDATVGKPASWQRRPDDVAFRPADGHDIDGTHGPIAVASLEKTADTITGDRIDDKTGKPVMSDTLRSDYNTVRDDVRGDMNSLRADVNNATYGTRAAADSGIGTGMSQV